MWQIIHPLGSGGSSKESGVFFITNELKKRYNSNIFGHQERYAFFFRKENISFC